MEFNHLYQELIEKIRKTIKLQKSLILFSKFLLSISFITIVILIGIVAEYYLKADSNFRTKLFYSILTLSIGSLILFNFKSLVNFLNNIGESELISYSKKIGNYFIDIKDRLTNNLQIFKENKTELSALALQEVYQKTKDKDFNLIVEKRSFKRSFIFSILTLSSFFILYFLNPNIQAAGMRILNFKKEFLPPIPFSIKLENKDKKLNRGAELDITITGEGDLPEIINLVIKEKDSEFEEEYKIKKTANNTYDFKLKSLKKDFDLFAKVNYLNVVITTDTAKISLFDLPLIKNFSGKLVNPSYTGISAQELNEVNGDISSLKGSRAYFELKTNVIPDSGYLVYQKQYFENDSLINKIQKSPLKIVNDKIKSELVVNSNGEYYFEIYSNSYKNENTIKYKIVALDDDYPEIELIDPATDVTLNSNLILPIRTKISDDYGLNKLILNYKMIYSKYAKPEENYKKIDLNIIKNSKDLSVPYVWELSNFDISPEDKYEFYLEVFDNDIVSGPKSTRTRSVIFRLPSLEEAFKESELAQKDIEEDINKLLKESQNLKKEIEDMQQDLRKKANEKKMDWDQKKEAQKIEEKRESLKEEFQKVQDKLEETTEKMQENNLLSEETMEKLAQLQKLMKEVNYSQLNKNNKIKQELDKMTPQQMEKALEQAKLTDEQFRQQVERSLKLMKKIQTEQKIDEITKKTKDIEKSLDEINKKLENKNLSEKEKEELSNKQQAQMDKMKDLENEMKDLAEKIKDLDDKKAAENFEKSVNELNPESTEKNMDEAKKEIQKGDKKQAQNKNEKAKSNLKEFAKKMQEMKADMQEKQSQKVMKQMQKSISDLLQLSKNQENLKNETSSVTNNSNLLPEIQNKQSDLSDALKNAASALEKLAEESMAIDPNMGQEIGKALNEMSRANQELAERRTQSSADAQKNAMSSLNKAAKQMEGSLSQMKSQMKGEGKGQCDNPGGQGEGEGKGEGNGMGGEDGSTPGQSFSQQLQLAAAQQQMIKQSMQQLMQQKMGENGEGEGSNPSDKKTGQYGRLKNQIGNAQKALEDLEEEQEKFSGTGNEKAKSELRKISEELKEIMQDIESGKINQQTLEKQDRIISKLLDAKMSANERDFQKKREAKTGKDYYNSDEENTDFLSEENKKKFQDELDKLKQKYSKDYEKIIKDYYKGLEK